jgi:hypothetical protein
MQLIHMFSFILFYTNNLILHIKKPCLISKKKIINLNILFYLFKAIKFFLPNYIFMGEHFTTLKYNNH